MQFRFFVALAILVSAAACSASGGSSNVPSSTVGSAIHRAAAGVVRPKAAATTYPTPYPDSNLLAHLPDGPHTFLDLEGSSTTGRIATPYTVVVSGQYPPFTLSPTTNQIIAGNAVVFSPTSPFTCIDNEIDSTGTPNGSSITAQAVGTTGTFSFVLALGPDNISPPTQFGCRFYFQDQLLNLHRITMYAGGPKTHPMTITPNVIQLSGNYPFTNPISKTITISEPDPNNAFNFGQTGSTFDGASLCTTVDGTLIGECRDAAPQTYDVNVAGGDGFNPPPHLLLQNITNNYNNHSLNLSWDGLSPNPVGSVSTMLIYDASGNYAPLVVNW